MKHYVETPRVFPLWLSILAGILLFIGWVVPVGLYSLLWILTLRIAV